MVNYDIAFEKLIGHEGGYVNNPKDPGGETKYGISKRSYPSLDIASLTLEDAKNIYKRDYWDKVRGDDLPYHTAFAMFDAAVNSGVTQAIRFAQKVLGVKVDGVLGPVTLSKMLSVPEKDFAVRYNMERLRFMTTLDTFPTFGRGWTNRIISNVMDLV